MNCPNCGAPMLLVRDRDYFQCEYCTTFHFPSPNQDGVRVLDENPDGLHCPICQEQLHRAVLDGLPALFCEKCQGILMSQNRFGEVVRRRRESATGAGIQLPPLDRRELERVVHCPVCAGKMDTYPYYGPGNIAIDVCSSCQVIWLDSGELRAIEQAPGSDRGGQAVHLRWRRDAQIRHDQKKSKKQTRVGD